MILSLILLISLFHICDLAILNEFIKIYLDEFYLYEILILTDEDFDLPYFDRDDILVNHIRVNESKKLEFLKTAQNEDLQNPRIYLIYSSDQENIDVILNSINLKKNNNWKPIIFLLWSNTTVIKEIPAKISSNFTSKLQIDSNFYIIVKFLNSNKASFIVWEQYFIGQDAITNEIRNFTKPYLTQFINLIVRRSDFKGINISSTFNDTEVYHNNLQLHILQILENTLNFKSHQIQNQENSLVDVILSSKLNEIQGYQKLTPTYSIGVRAFYKQPPLSSIENRFLLPFDMSVWLAIIFIFPTISVCFLISSEIKQRSEGTLEGRDRFVREDGGIWTFGMICQQGCHFFPESISLQIIFFTGLLTGLVTFIAYSGAIVSSLSFQKPPIENIEELNSAEFKFYIDINSTVIQKIETLSKTYKIEGQFTDIINGISLILKGDSVLLSNVNNFYFAVNALNLSHEMICREIFQIRMKYSIYTKSGLWTRVNSPYKEYFNHKIIRILGTGLVKRMILRIQSSTRPNCPSQNLVDDNSHFIPEMISRRGRQVNFWDIFVALQFLIGFQVISLVVYFIEKFWYGRQIKKLFIR